LSGLVLRSVTDDPQTGKVDDELVNISLAEPDAASFEPPEGYEIVNREMKAPCVNKASPPSE